VPREGPHTPTHPHARTHAHTRRRARTQTHKRLNVRVSTIAQRAQTHNLLSTPSRARAQIRTARICSRAHGPYRRGGSARTSAAEPAAASRLPTDRMRARTRGCIFRYRAQPGDAVAHRYPQQQPWRHCRSHLAIYPTIYAPTHAHTYMCIHRWTNMDQYIYAHAHGVCSRVWASRGDARERMRGGWAAGTLEHLPGRRAMRSSRERRRAAAWLHLSVRPSRVGHRRWCGGGSCHGRDRGASAGAAVLNRSRRPCRALCGDGAEVRIGRRGNRH